MNELPPELTYRILLNTDFEDLKALCKVDTLRYSICNDPKFWIDKIMKDFGITHDYIKDSKTNPYLIYQIINIIGSNCDIYHPDETCFYQIGRSGNANVINYYINQNLRDRLIYEFILLGLLDSRNLDMVIQIIEKYNRYKSYDDDNIYSLIFDYIVKQNNVDALI